MSLINNHLRGVNVHLGIKIDPEDGYIFVPECATLGETIIQLGGHYENYNANWNFVAHARTDIPALIARVRELEAERGAVTAKWCKDGETIEQRLKREREDTLTLMSTLAVAKQRAERAEAEVERLRAALETLAKNHWVVGQGPLTTKPWICGKLWQEWPECVVGEGDTILEAIQNAEAAHGPSLAKRDLEEITAQDLTEDGETHG